MIKAVLFDLDDTLITTRDSKFEALKATGKQYYNLVITDDHIKRYWGVAFRELILSIFGDIDTIDSIISKYKVVRDSYPASTHKGALETIQLILNNGIKIGIISSASREFVIKDLKLLGFPVEEFVYVQGAEDTKVHKPDPDVFLPTMKILTAKGIYACNTLYVGDLMMDYQAATGAGFEFLGIIRWGTTREEFEKAGAKTIQELPEILGYINGVKKSI